MTPNMIDCPFCEPGEPGWVIVNPDWPRGEKHYREACPECGGLGQIHRDCLPSEDEMVAEMADLWAATRG